MKPSDDKDYGPWKLRKDSDGRWRICSDNFEHDVELILTGDFADDPGFVKYAQDIMERLSARSSVAKNEGETPRADALLRQLERELAASEKERKRLMELRRQDTIEVGKVLSEEIARSARGEFLQMIEMTRKAIGPMPHPHKGDLYWQGMSWVLDRLTAMVNSGEYVPPSLTPEQIKAGAAFIMGPGGDEGTRFCTCNSYPHKPNCGEPDGDIDDGRKP